MESVTVESANPAGFYQAISDTAAAPAQGLTAELFLPDGEPPFAAVAVVPGSLGVAPSHLHKAELLTAVGVAALVVDPFTARSVASTVANQAQYSFAASAWDVLAACRLLAEREEIDAARIGAQGHSRGGSAVLNAICLARLAPTIGPAPCAVYAAYPWCGHQFLKPEIGNTVVRAIIGERDDWCLPQQVQAQIHAMRLTGGDASVRIVEGADHSFDRDTAVERIDEASVAPGAPTAYIADDGAMIHPLGDAPDPSLTEHDVMRYSVKSGHGRRGAHIGTTGNLAEVFHADMMAFWTRVLSAK